MVDEQRMIWSYPKYTKQDNPLPVQSRVGRVSLSTEDEKDNSFEFNDLETDERINMDVFQFDMAFPDPLHFCIGFMAH